MLEVGIGRMCDGVGVVESSTGHVIMSVGGMECKLFILRIRIRYEEFHIAVAACCMACFEFCTSLYSSL